MDFVEPVMDDDEAATTLYARRYTRSSGLQHRSGNSGYRCEACGDAIPEDRRQAEPGTQHCADCKDTLQFLIKEACDDL
ncbi:TraR/DksA C4-type zinc finger protein [Pseudomonas sp. NPDC089734]|uniref:TraR/DksA C4-type zinc finger protein n=1 Tax=Pseudomonas sp. NPDC089734 TaxID=3364469 RepID=UPI0038145E81